MRVVSGGDVGDKPPPPTPATPRGRLSPRIGAAWVLTVLTAYLVGYLAGGDRTTTAPSPAASTPTTRVLGGQVHWGGASCWQSDGGVLTVGMIVNNDSPDPAVLTSIDVDVQGAPGNPQVFVGWGDCDATGSAGPALVPAGQQAWARMSVYAPLGCPTDLRIAFTVTYRLNGHADTLPPSSPDPDRIACAGS